MAKIALLIGVSEYRDGLNPLPSAARDVEALQRVLENPELGRFDRVISLVNPSRGDTEAAIFDLFSQKQDDDLILLYFSGHGLQDDRFKFYFATTESRKQNGKLLPYTAIGAAYVQEHMQSCKAQRQVVILDCCFSAAFVKGLTAKDAGTINLEAQLGGRGRAILTAANSNDYAFEQEGYDLSVYTHYLVEGLETGAADLDDDGEVEIAELNEYVCSRVKEANPNMSPGFFPVREGYTIKLTKSPKDDPRLKYRKEVERRTTKDGKFTVPALRILNAKRLEWGLSEAEAQSIEDEVLQPYRDYERKLKEYETCLQEALEDENPLSVQVEADLAEYQQILGLRDEDVEPIKIQLQNPKPPQKGSNHARLSDVLKAMDRNSDHVRLSDVLKAMDRNSDHVRLSDVVKATQRNADSDDDLSSEKDIDYTRLRDLLRTGQWREADEETYYLMINTFKKGKSFDREDLESFPCKDLKTIDRLWVKYSNGKWGISVQKRIWEECGCPMEYNEDWEMFGDRVGWRKAGSRMGDGWLDYDSFTFDPKHSKEGELPLWVICWGDRFLAGLLFSRVKYCEV